MFSAMSEYSSFKTNELDKCTSFSCMGDFPTLLKSIFTKYMDGLRSFFSNKKAEIQSIYKAIRNKEFPNNRVSIIDINIASSIYFDYFHGLVDFVSRVGNLQTTDDVSKDVVVNKLNTVETKNRLFIDDLANGKNHLADNSDNNELCEECDINSAMKNVEFLVSLNSLFDDYVYKIKEVIDATNSSQEYYDVTLHAVKVLIESLAFFGAKCVDIIISTYNSIINSMQSRASARKQDAIPAYQVF